MDEREKQFAETIKNRLIAELSDETLNMIWGWKNRVQAEICPACKEAGRIDLLREMIDELTRDAEANELVNNIMAKTKSDKNGGTQ
ncbi:MAG: hypothetical protein D6B25_07300 [Desulfobulbaceae bacterium]|nr:MAG: hypothetical protein D6B25_07300 [Desulfobulbaceae bacterium]